MNRVLEDIQPKNVFRFFEDICNIPHGSGNVEKISRYLVDFAKERGLDYRQDENFNVVIRKPSTKRSRPSFSISLSLSGVLTATISICP